MSERELHRLVKETVHETLSHIGLEANQIGEVQRKHYSPLLVCWPLPPSHCL
jgi:hypothetical protein